MAFGPSDAVALQNRVDPWGELAATTARGTLMGNRGGRFHRPDRTLGPRRWAGRQWIACRLEFRGRRRQVWSPNSCTELFFLDEATALAAGHRPCFECRRDDARQFLHCWAKASAIPRPAAQDLDAALHADRVIPGTRQKRTFVVPGLSLPGGAFIVDPSAGDALLLLEGAALPWSFEGYGPPRPVPRGNVTVLTPAAVIAALRQGYRPAVHPSALASLRRNA